MRYIYSSTQALLIRHLSLDPVNCTLFFVLVFSFFILSSLYSTQYIFLYTIECWPAPFLPLSRQSPPAPLFARSSTSFRPSLFQLLPFLVFHHYVLHRPFGFHPAKNGHLNCSAFPGSIIARGSEVVCSPCCPSPAWPPPPPQSRRGPDGGESLQDNVVSSSSGTTTPAPA